MDRCRQVPAVGSPRQVPGQSDSRLLAWIQKVHCDSLLGTVIEAPVSPVLPYIVDLVVATPFDGRLRVQKLACQGEYSVRKIAYCSGLAIMLFGLAACVSPPAPPTATTVSVSVESPTLPPTVVPVPTLADTPTVLPSLTPLPTVTAVPSPTSHPVTATAEPSAIPATPTATNPTIELPVTSSNVVLPIHILAHVGNPGDRVTAELRWADGTVLKGTLPVVKGDDGRGLVIDSLGWQTESQPPQPPTQAATLILRGADGQVLAQQAATVLGDADPNTRLITLYWIGGNRLYPIPRRVIKTPQIATAAIEELLWGPSPGNLAGFTSAFPTPDDVLHFAGRQNDWGPRVTLRHLTIVDGAATVDFSKELRAYGGGSARVIFLRDQVTKTLLQFSTIKTVRIAIEGQTQGVLEP